MYRPSASIILLNSKRKEEKKKKLIEKKIFTLVLAVRGATATDGQRGGATPWIAYSALQHTLDFGCADDRKNRLSIVGRRRRRRRRRYDMVDACAWEITRDALATWPQT